MTPAHISQLIIEYRYWILIPLAIVEGPIVAFIAGTLASLNYFNIYILVLIMFVRDLGLDAIWYGLGYWGSATKFAKRMLARMKVTEGHINDVRLLWEKKPIRTMFIGKLSYGISGAFVVAAGTVKMPLKKFFACGAIVTVCQYGGLLALGYFFGQVYGASLTGIVQNIQYVIAGITLVISIFYGVSWYMRGKFIRAEKGVEKDVEKDAAKTEIKN
jgi:membrane protein DedA with SNARE-associated domain